MESDDKNRDGPEENEEIPKPGWEDYRGAIVMVLIFIVTIILALTLSPIYTSQGMKAFEDEEAVINPLLYIAFIIVFTVIVLWVVKKGKKNLMKLFFLGAILITIVNVVAPLIDGAVYGWGEEWTTGFGGRNVRALDAINIDGKTYHLILEEGGEFHVFLDDGSIFSSQEGMPLSGRYGISAFHISGNGTAYDTAIVAVEGKELRLFSLSSPGGTPEVSPLFSFPGNSSSYRFDEENDIILLAGLRGSEGNETVNLAAVSIEIDGTGETTANPAWTVERELCDMMTGSNGAGNITEKDVGAVTVLLKDTDNYTMALSADDETLFFDGRSLEYRSMVDSPDTVDSAVLVENDNTDDLILFSDEEFRVYSLDNGNYSLADKEKIEKGIDDLTVAKTGNGDEEAIYVLSDGKVYVYGFGKSIKSRGYSEERVKGAKGLSVTDVDDDGKMEFNILTGNGIRVYEIDSVSIHIWAWLIGGVIGLLSMALIRYYPEWYVVDAVGILVAVGAIALIGISLAIFPVLVLLAALAVYDAISVYKTKHMISLADNVMEMRLPVLLIIPKSAKYSFREQKGLKEQLEDGEKRDAMFMGLGDIIIPGILAVSAFTYLPEGMIGGIGKPLVVALSTVIGGVAGFIVLMRFVMKGRPQAGLPLLNGGTIAGYLVSYLLVYGDLTFNLSFRFF